MNVLDWWQARLQRAYRKIWNAHIQSLYADTTDYNDEIKIPIQQQYVYTHCRESFLYIEGKVTNFNNMGAPVRILANNCAAFLFDKLRYKLDGVEIDRSVESIQQKCWNNNHDQKLCITNDGEKQNTKIRIMKWRWISSEWRKLQLLRIAYTLLRFCENYRRIIINARHKLLIRSRKNNCLIGQANPKIELQKIQ